jgi:hypothetical protein
VKPADAAVRALVTKAGAWNASTTPIQAEADAKAAIDSMISLEPKLSSLAFTYPAAAPDLTAEIDAAGRIQTDIAELGTVPAADRSSWTQTFRADVSSLNAAGAKVSADLGVSAPSS